MKNRIVSNKIAIKLTTYFSITLLLFSVIIGSLFMTLFKNNTMEIYKNDLENRAVTIAETLSGYMSNSGNVNINGSDDHMMGEGYKNMIGGRMNGLGMYLQIIDDIAMTNLWIVDENLQLFTVNHMNNKSYNYADLPMDAETVVKEVFQGKTTFSENFSSLLDTPTLTIGAPIMANGKVIGALLLHSPLEGMTNTIAQSNGILAMSIIAALVLSLLLSIALAVTFTKPLKKMQVVAIQIANGNYEAKTGVNQTDEIGELASAIDVLSERLKIASQESEQLEKQRRDFIANISHELRTPVTVIRGSLEALCDEVVTDPEQVKNYHGQMLNDSKALQRLVNDLLDLTRLQNTDFKMEKIQLNLCDVLQDVVRSSYPIAKPKNVDVELTLDSDTFTFIGDYGRLRQMFLIVLDNAIKFSEERGLVTIKLENGIVYITDRGCGIPQSDLPYIFDRFHKASSKKNPEGTGLGLAIAKQIADRHNITITIDSEEGKGTEFIFKLS